MRFTSSTLGRYLANLFSMKFFSLMRYFFIVSSSSKSFFYRSLSRAFYSFSTCNLDTYYNNCFSSSPFSNSILYLSFSVFMTSSISLYLRSNSSLYLLISASASSFSTFFYNSNSFIFLSISSFISFSTKSYSFYLF